MKSLILVLTCVFAAAAADAAVAEGQSTTAAVVGTVSKGQMVETSSGARLGAVYRVAADGSPQIMFDGKLVTIPASTLSSSNGKLITTLSKSEVSGLHQ
jgi:hypothetical protein